MLSIGLISLLIAVPLFSYYFTPSLFNRITCITLFYASFLSSPTFSINTNGNSFWSNLESGVGIYSGLFHVNNVSLWIESFIYFVGGLLLFGWASQYNNTSESISFTTNNSTHNNNIYQESSFIPTINEYSLLILFTTIGASILVSSSDLISMYLCIELQSFAVYILATLYRNSESATAAGLKYFLLGGLSSALILLGSSIIYSNTGLTNFEGIYNLLSVIVDNTNNEQNEVVLPVIFGLLLIGSGFLFKVSAAPFHNWAPDVYDGTPTIVTSWLSTMPKISIFVFLLELITGLQGSLECISLNTMSDFTGNYFAGNIWKNLLLAASLLSLVLGTVLGLSQYRIKRLLTYSTISHVGFLLLALAINTEESVESFLFYIIQYSLTNVNVFLILLAFGYSINKIVYFSSEKESGNINNHNIHSIGEDIQFIDELKGQFYKNPLLSFSFAICLFSIAGIPPLIGFFAKQIVLYSSTHSGYYFLSIVAILVSVISASYYLKIVQVIYFDNNTSSNSYNSNEINTNYNITNVHSILIAILTAVLSLFVLHPTILLNISHLLSLSLYYY